MSGVIPSLAVGGVKDTFPASDDSQQGAPGPLYLDPEMSMFIGYRDISRCSTERPIFCRYRKCETAGSPEANRGAILCLRKQGSATAANTVEKTRRNQ
jgi:hypothetical protein